LFSFFAQQNSRNRLELAWQKRAGNGPNPPTDLAKQGQTISCGGTPDLTSREASKARPQASTPSLTNTQTNIDPKTAAEATATGHGNPNGPANAGNQPTQIATIHPETASTPPRDLRTVNSSAIGTPNTTVNTASTGTTTIHTSIPDLLSRPL
jgi:hypothetical protein